MKNKHISSLSREQREKRRLKAAKLFKKGLSHADIARKLGVTNAAITQWRAVYSRGGAKALRSKGHPGFASKLTAKKQEKFRKAILEGPLVHGYTTNLWTLPRLSAMMKKVTGVRFNPVWTWRMVRRMGFTPQKPQMKAKQRKERVIAGWKAKTLPKLKKMGT